MFVCIAEPIASITSNYSLKTIKKKCPLNQVCIVHFLFVLKKNLQFNSTATRSQSVCVLACLAYYSVFKPFYEDDEVKKQTAFIIN